MCNIYIYYIHEKSAEIKQNVSIHIIKNDPHCAFSHSINSMHTISGRNFEGISVESKC